MRLLCVFALVCMLAVPAWATPPQDPVDAPSVTAVEGIITNNFTANTDLGWQSGNQATWDNGLEWGASNFMAQLNTARLDNQYLEGTLRLSNLAGLYDVNAVGNKLTGYDFTGSDNLVTINLSNNQISRIQGLSHLTSLRDLFLSNNQISQIQGLENLTSLQNLSLSNNQISQIQGLEGLTSLQTLNLDNNQISQIQGLENLTSLNTLRLSNNQLTSLQGLESLASTLEGLYIGGNQFTSLRELQNFTSLKALGLNSSNLSNISAIPGLSGFTSLRDLFLSNNQISQIQGLENLTSLQTLYLAYNRISQIQGLENLTGLQNLYLSGNQISQIQGLEGLTSLQSLDLADNQISQIQGLENLTSLQNLYLADNQISQIQSLENLTSLQNLDLVGNQISQIQGLENLTSLQSLYLSHNQISQIQGLENLTSLQNLHLADNQISQIQGLGSLASLQYLNLDYNQISVIQGLENLTSLQSLYLSNNQISRIQGLDNLNNLRYLDVSGNRLPLSELYKVSQLGLPSLQSYNLGNDIAGAQYNVLPVAQVMRGQGQVDLSSEYSINNTLTSFSVTNSQNQPISVTNNNGLLSLAPGRYNVKMTNPQVYSPGNFTYMLVGGETIILVNPQAVAWATYQVYQASYANTYGYNVNSQGLGQALDRAMDNGYVPRGELSDLLALADETNSATTFNQATGETLALGRHAMVLVTAKPFMNDVNNLYLNSAGLSAGLSAGQQSELAGQLAAGEAGAAGASPWRMNFTPLGGWGGHSGADNIQGYDVQRYGGFVNLDHTWTDFMLGAAFTFAKTRLDYDNTSSKTDADSMALALYGRHNFGQWFVGGQLGLGYAMVDNHRALGPTASAKSNYDMYWYQAGLAGGYDIQLGDVLVTPSLGLAYLGSHSQGFEEKNVGNLSLDVDSENMNSLEVQALVDASTTLTTSGGFALKPRLKLGLAYELADNNASIHTRFSQIPELGVLEAQSADTGRVRFIGGLGLDMSLSQDVSFAVDYETSIQQDYQYHQGTVSLKFKF